MNIYNITNISSIIINGMYICYLYMYIYYAINIDKTFNSIAVET